MNLVPGSKTVTEYVNEFDGLAKFAFDLVPTDVAGKEQFIQGLNSVVARASRSP